MFRVGQRILTKSLKEGRVIDILEGGKAHVLLSDKIARVPFEDIFSVIQGPQSPETEDVGFITFEVEDTSRSAPKHRYFETGEVVCWDYPVGGASLEIKGSVLYFKRGKIVASEWGVSFPMRRWVIPTNKLSKCRPY